MEINVIPDWTNFGLQLLNTALLFFIVRHFAWKPVKAFLKQRQDLLQQEVDEAHELKNSSETLLQDAQMKIKTAREEGKGIVEKAKTRAMEVHDELIAKAKEDVQRSREKVREELEQEKRHVYAVIREDMVELAIESTQKLLQEEFSPEKNSRLFHDFLKNVGEAHE